MMKRMQMLEIRVIGCFLDLVGGVVERGRGGRPRGREDTIIAVTEGGGRTVFFAALEGLSKGLVLEMMGRWVEKGSAVRADDLRIYGKEMEENATGTGPSEDTRARGGLQRATRT